MRAATNPARWIEGEKLIAIQPAPERAGDAGFRRRILPFPGRSLSHLALHAEQDQRAGRLALRGQMVSPGVVSGLEVDFDRLRRDAIVIAPGFGVAATGEDVSLRRPIQIAPGDLLVRRNPDDPQSLDSPLRELPQRARVLALVLQPVEIVSREDGDPENPCENDPAADAFADHQRIDGALPVWVPLPESLESIFRNAPDATMRNTLAHAIFQQEIDVPKRDAAVRAGTDLPFSWQYAGVPLALVGFDDRGLVRFVDRHAVVRAGGKARPRTPLLLQENLRSLYTGAPALWQARIDQLGEHLLDLVVANRVEPGAVYRAFAFAPPAGILPLDLVSSLPDPDRSQRFFPDQATIEWAPIPVEHLDSAITAAASLARFDFSLRFVVRLLVPVPQSVYEPRLLLTEAPNQALLDEKDRLGVVLAQRRFVRDRSIDQRAELEAALGGDDSVTPSPSNAGADEAETQPFEEGDTPQIPAILAVAPEIEALRQAAARLCGPAAVETFAQASLDAHGLRGARREIALLADKSDDAVDFGFLRVQADLYRHRQLVLGTQKASQLITSPALAAVVQTSTAFATAKDLETVFAKTARVRAVDAPKAPKAVAAVRAPKAASAEPALRSVVASPALRAIKEGSSVLAKEKAEEPFAGLLAKKAAPAPKKAAAYGIDSDVKEEIGSRLPFESPGIDRTVTIAERLPEAPATQARASSKASKYGTLESLAKVSALGFDDVNVTLPELDESGKPTGKSRPQKLQDAIGKLGDLSQHEAEIDRIPEGNEGDPSFSDEALHLSSGIRMLDDTIGVLRQIEIKVRNLRQILSLVDAAIAKIAGELDTVVSRVATAERSLAEARHDFAVALALVQEDADNVAATNARRHQVIQDHARFVAFVRPRTQDLTDDVPGRDLESPDEMPVPACFNEEIGTVPPEIRQAVDLVRRAPLQWLPPYHALLDALDDTPTLTHMVRSTIQLASLTMTAKTQSAVQVSSRPAARGLEAGFASMEAQLTERTEALRDFDTARIDQVSWATLRTDALKFVSFSDFVHVGHLRPDVLHTASLAIDRMTRVATCLYRRFAEVRADIRLAWAEQLSVFDTAVGLRDLFALRRFQEVDPDDREGMQALVDWLFSQIASLPRPLAMMDNLVRVCALLASHAPVRQLLRGTIQKTTVTVGNVVRIQAIDVLKTRVGMKVLVGKTGLAHAVVEDVSGGFATARITKTARPSVELADDTEAILAEAEQFAATAAKVVQNASAFRKR